MKTNIKHIWLGDSDATIIDAINLNFDQLLYSGIGYVGDDGPVGASGYVGQVGSRGIQGSTGENASTWYRQDDAPSDGVKEYDVWINTAPGSTGSGTIYYYNGSSWVSTNDSITKNSVFFLYEEITGLGGLTDKNAITFSDILNPDTQTFVVSDYPVDSTNANYNYSKLKIAVSGNSVLPIFTFYRINENISQPPSFYWRNLVSGDHGIKLASENSFIVESRDSVSFLAGGGTGSGSTGGISIIARSKAFIDALGSVYLSAGGTASDYVSMEAGLGNFNMDTLNFKIDTSQSSFGYGLKASSFSATGASYNPRVKITSKIPTSLPLMDTSSYSSDSLTASSVELEDFRNGNQAAGQGIFRTELVQSGTDYLPYVKYGYPGVTGAYPIKAVTQFNTAFTNVAIGTGTYSRVDVSSTGLYTAQGISIITTNSGTPLNDVIYLKVFQSTTSSIVGLYDLDTIGSYRFYYAGNLYNGTYNRTYKIGGIHYTEIGVGSRSISFNTPVQTFELSYYGPGDVMYYKTFDDCGIIDFAGSVSTGGGGGGGID